MVQASAQASAKARTPGRIAEALRLSGWGVTAIAAVTLAAAIGLSDAGLARLTAIAMSQPAAMMPLDPGADTAANAAPPMLVEELKALAADRDRLAARLLAVEQNLGSVTAMVAQSLERASVERATAPRLPPADRVDVAAAPAAVPAPAAAVEPRTLPNPVPPGFVLLEPALGLNRAPFSTDHSDEAWARAPLPQPAPPPAVVAVAPAREAADPTPTASIPQRTEFGLDLGGAPNAEGLRALWTATMSRHRADLERLRPVSGARAGSREPRLVAGPLPTAAAAARLCATLTAAGTACTPMVFDGNRPVLR